MASRLFGGMFRILGASRTSIQTPLHSAPRDRVIALDADGVLIDYHEGYAQAWERAFGVRPDIRDPLGYHPANFWAVPALEGTQLQQLRERGLTEEAWRTMPALPGAAVACRLLRNAGYRVVCVTALEPRFAAARTENLQSHGIQVDEVIATGVSSRHGNPKAAVIHKLQPCLFVDDCLTFLQGLPSTTWRALIDLRPHFSPNQDPALEPPHSRHISLLDAVRFWLARCERPSGETGQVLGSFSGGRETGAVQVDQPRKR